ncbi:hypothetical protein HPP92_022463 [Vanilla planifolia]|uniref:Uncharacterized protein n=1 Tax=Vanilla planifolia TaxID=51239 RepID=A0A835PS91_VANPL|nr:hypothetical protein HPP92_022463 [Vanilla planifolia]
MEVICLVENGKSTTDDRHEPCKSHSKFCCCALDEDGCYQCFSGPNHATVNSMFKVGNSLPLIKVPSIHSSTDNGEFLWAPVTDRLELPLKPFNNPNSSDSPCISESGSDIHSKREVLKKLRLQLRSRDDMIMEMQAQITDLQKSMNIQVALTTHLQNQLSSSTEFLSDSEREIHRLQKSIADHFVCETGLPENTWR